MRALVTGAGGFLGGAIVRALSARGDAVRALVRRPAEGLSLPRVEIATGDATDPAALRAAVRGCDVVFHLAGVRRATDPAEFLRVNAGSTRAVLEACLAEAPRLARLVLAGSLGAVGPARVPQREDAPFAPVEPYGVSKAEAERIALSYADRLPVAVARPPRIMGPGDRENLLFFLIARAGLALSFGNRPLSWIDVDDCARGFILLAERPEAAGEVFFLASPETTTAAGLMAEAARALGVRAACSHSGAAAARRRGCRRSRDERDRTQASAEPEARGAAPRAGLGVRPVEGPRPARVRGPHLARGLDRARRALVPRARVAVAVLVHIVPPPTSRSRRTITTPFRSPHAAQTSYVISFTTRTSGCSSAGAIRMPQVGQVSSATRSFRASICERRIEGGQWLHSTP
jgi:nucleoside-diphosphate-sugar epimerase